MDGNPPSPASRRPRTRRVDRRQFLAGSAGAATLLPCYGSNLERLREVKKQVDRGFRFRFARAIPPAR